MTAVLFTLKLIAILNVEINGNLLEVSETELIHL